MVEPSVSAMNEAHSPAELKKNWGSSFLWTLPMMIWALLVFSKGLSQGLLAERIAAIATVTFLGGVFLWMMRSGETYRPRRVFFVALGFLFPVGFILELVAQRGTMSISLEQMILGNTPFCHLALPMMALPGILSKTIIFPGSILPKPENPHAFGTMLALWVGATLILGRGWCSWGCFFGGIEEGFASLRRKPIIQKISRRWTLFPWAILVLVIVGTAISLAPFYCEWLMPFQDRHRISRGDLPEDGRAVWDFHGSLRRPRCHPPLLDHGKGHNVLFSAPWGQSNRWRTRSIFLS